MTEVQSQKRSLFLLACIIGIDSLGLGIIIPVGPELISELGQVSYIEAVSIAGWLMASYGLMMFVFAPVIGGLGDTYGRRPVLITCLTLLSIDYVIMYLAPELWWLFVTRMIAGILGSTFPVVNAYIADISEPEKRAARYGMMGAAWGLGFTVGPLLGGILGDINWRMPFIVSAGLIATTAVGVYFVLPESLPKSSRRAFSLATSNAIQPLLNARKLVGFLPIFAAVLLYQIAHDVNPSVWTYYTIEKFDWTPIQNGYSLAFVGLSVILVQAMLVGPAVAKLGAQKVALIGFSIFGLSYIGFALAATGLWMYTFIIFFAIGSMGSPALRSILTECVDKSHQGELQGTLTSLMSLSSVVTPLTMAYLLQNFSDDSGIYFPGAPYLAGALAMLVCVTLIIRNLSRLVSVATANREADQ